MKKKDKVFHWLCIKNRSWNCNMKMNVELRMKKIKVHLRMADELDFFFHLLKRQRWWWWGRRGSGKYFNSAVTCTFFHITRSMQMPWKVKGEGWIDTQSQRLNIAQVPTKLNCYIDWWYFAAACVLRATSLCCCCCCFTRCNPLYLQVNTCSPYFTRFNL